MAKVPAPLQAAVRRTLLAWIQTWAPIRHALGQAAAPQRACGHAGQQRADDAADGVDPEHVERVVVAEHALQAGRREEAAGPRDAADQKRARGTCRARTQA